jgi:hypothetical protein
MSLSCSNDAQESSRSNVETLLSHLLLHLSLLNIVLYNVIVKVIWDYRRVLFSQSDKASNELLVVRIELKLGVPSFLMHKAHMSAKL